MSPRKFDQPSQNSGLGGHCYDTFTQAECERQPQIFSSPLCRYRRTRIWLASEPWFRQTTPMWYQLLWCNVSESTVNLPSSICFCCAASILVIISLLRLVSNGNKLIHSGLGCQFKAGAGALKLKLEPLKRFSGSLCRPLRH